MLYDIVVGAISVGVCVPGYGPPCPAIDDRQTEGCSARFCHTCFDEWTMCGEPMYHGGPGMSYRSTASLLCARARATVCVRELQRRVFKSLCCVRESPCCLRGSLRCVREPHCVRQYLCWSLCCMRESPCRCKSSVRVIVLAIVLVREPLHV